MKVVKPRNPLTRRALTASPRAIGLLRRCALRSIVIMSIAVGPVQSQLSAPAGWTTSIDRSVESFIPADVPMGATFAIAAFPAQPTGGREPTAWLDAHAIADVAAMKNARAGRRTPVMTHRGGLLSTSHQLRTTSGAQLVALYFGATLADGRIRLLRVTASSAELLKRYEGATTDIISAIAAPPESTVAASVPAASAELNPQAPAPPTPTLPAYDDHDVSRISRNVLVRTPAPRRNAFRAGGALQPGRYVGRQIYTDSREVRTEMTLWLFANGEYRQEYRNSREDLREGEFAYDPVTGRIDLEWGSLMTITNSRIDPNVDFAVIGKAEDGTPALLAENDRGFHTLLTLLVRTGPNDRPNPSRAKEIAAAAAAESARYKHVVPAGQGVQESQIAGVYLHSVMHQTMGLSFQLGVSSTLNLYLLLNDGTIHDGLPVAPDEMDIATSRRREPERWGRWRRAAGGIEVSWNASPNDWKPLEGERMQKPRDGEELRGRFSGGESSAAGDASSFSLYGVTFGPGRSFATDSRGGSGTGSFTATMGGTSVQTTRDDEGSVTTASTPDVGVSSARRNAGPSRSGTYRISGWTLEARYSDGRVVRQPFFFVDDKRDAIYWQGKIVNLGTGAPRSATRAVVPRCSVGYECQRHSPHC